MRASIVVLLASGCGIVGGKSIEGTWEGTCDAEDDDGNNYDYDVTLDFRDIGGGDAEGDGEFDSTIQLAFTYYGYYYSDEFELHGDGDLSAELSDKEWTIEGSGWALEIDGQSLDDLDSADWTLLATRKGEELSGDIELDLAGEITVRGTCDFDLKK